MDLNTIKPDGTNGTAIKVDNRVFKIKPNEAVVHQAVIQEMHNQRQGTHSSKSRGMVRGGGRKPWRQKGRGVARAGTIRSPLWKGGGTVFGPEPHPYKKRMPKKMKQLARKSVLSYKAGKGEIFIVDDLTQPEPKNALENAALGTCSGILNDAADRSTKNWNCLQLREGRSIAASVSRLCQKAAGAAWQDKHDVGAPGQVAARLCD